jgi:hypothetical protein
MRSVRVMGGGWRGRVLRVGLEGRMVGSRSLEVLEGFAEDKRV